MNSQLAQPAVEAGPAQIQIGTRDFQRVRRALFFGGFSTFALLYCVQPLMPLFSHEFHLSPSQSSWSLSVSTAALALCLLFASAVSDAVGRKPLMCFALFGSALMTVLCAFAQNYAQLLVCRALLGIVLAGLPAVAMAYLSEEIEPKSLGYAMGLYIGGSAFGGMTGRVVASILSDHLSWRMALLIVGVAGLAAAAEFLRSLPASRNFSKRALSFVAMPAAMRKHLSDEGLPWFFLIGFLLMGCFVSLYNYISYRLLSPEFGLSQSAVGAISALYLIGIFSSVWSGKMADKFGRRRVLWALIAVMLCGLLLTLAHGLILVIAGIALFTFGFFGGHSITSSWVGRRARPPQALASALYLFAYYLGSSLIGSCSGLIWKMDGWNGVVMVLAVLLTAAVAISLRLSRLALLQVQPA
ncbi:MFS transporter [Undibacterium terreum]|uniref:MFS transporter n=1 Tax=Undibacterium terreum TaxID=1224302 RepID=A0A916U2V0_9BURK|nr:MFS transporter [Undibacterium terreum]GGC58562.1 MFS transporter [Undibacterium terreum]